MAKANGKRYIIRRAKDLYTATWRFRCVHSKGSLRDPQRLPKPDTTLAALASWSSVACCPLFCQRCPLPLSIWRLFSRAVSFFCSGNKPVDTIVCSPNDVISVGQDAQVLLPYLPWRLLGFLNCQGRGSFRGLDHHLLSRLEGIFLRWVWT